MNRFKVYAPLALNILVVAIMLYVNIQNYSEGLTQSQWLHIAEMVVLCFVSISLGVLSCQVAQYVIEGKELNNRKNHKDV